ncbi:MAG: hypothetical protein V4660_06240 [Pseudomonadota bacterium]
MRKKIVFAVGSVLSFAAVKVLAATLLVSPSYVTPYCSWSNIGGGLYPPVTVTVTGLFCYGVGPILVKQVISQPGSQSCSLFPGGFTHIFTLSGALTCDSYSVTTK